MSLSSLALRALCRHIILAELVFNIPAYETERRKRLPTLTPEPDVVHRIKMIVARHGAELVRTLTLTNPNNPWTDDDAVLAISGRCERAFFKSLTQFSGVTTLTLEGIRLVGPARLALDGLQVLTNLSLNACVVDSGRCLPLASLRMDLCTRGDDASLLEPLHLVDGADLTVLALNARGYSDKWRSAHAGVLASLLAGDKSLAGVVDLEVDVTYIRRALFLKLAERCSSVERLVLHASMYEPSVESGPIEYTGPAPLLPKLRHLSATFFNAEDWVAFFNSDAEAGSIVSLTLLERQDFRTDTRGALGDDLQLRPYRDWLPTTLRLAATASSSLTSLTLSQPLNAADVVPTFTLLRESFPALRDLTISLKFWFTDLDEHQVDAFKHLLFDLYLPMILAPIQGMWTFPWYFKYLRIRVVPNPDASAHESLADFLRAYHSIHGPRQFVRLPSGRGVMGRVQIEYDGMTDTFRRVPQPGRVEYDWDWVERQIPESVPRIQRERVEEQSMGSVVSRLVSRLRRNS